MLIEHLHKAKETEIRANLATPMSEERMPEFVLEQYQNMYGTQESEILLALIGNKKENASNDELEAFLGVHTFVLDL